MFGIYFTNFYGSLFSIHQSNCGAFGDYIGGLLNPILSFILICLVIKEAVETHSNYNQQQNNIEEQIRLLTPMPAVVYYLRKSNSTIYAIIKNIGNAVAYDINSEITFDEDDKKKLPDEIFQMEQLNYLAPKQKASIFLGHQSILNGYVSIPEHKVTIVFFGIRDKRTVFERIFIINNILQTLFSENDLEGAIQNVANNLENLKENA